MSWYNWFLMGMGDVIINTPVPVSVCLSVYVSAGLTLRPGKRERALRGPRALRVLRNWIAPIPENPHMSAISDTRKTWKIQH